MRLTRSQCKEEVLRLVEGDLSEDIEESCVELPEAFKKAHSRLKRGEPTYILPGFEKLTEAIGGMPHRGFTILTGPSGAGKSTLVGNLWFGHNAVGKNIYTVPIEIGSDDFMDMLLSIISAKTRRKLRKEDYEEARTKWLPTFFSNRGHVMALHESRLSHLDFLAEVYYHHLERGVGVAFGDNWNFMLEPAKGGDAVSLNDKALHDCIVFSKKVPVHIYMIMHPKKDTKSESERIESMFDIKGSSTSPQEATNVWLFNRLHKDNTMKVPPMTPPEFCREIKVAKARYNGRAEGTTVMYAIDQNSELYREVEVL